MKKQLKSIAKSITVFILLIFCAVVIDARAEDYLWEPTLAWEDPSPGIGHKLLNNDEWLIYYADNKVQLRELATGKKLAESEDLLKLLNEKNCTKASFSMSSDGKIIYGLFEFYYSQKLIIFEAAAFKVVKIINVIGETKGCGTHYICTDKRKFYISSQPQSGYVVSDNDFRMIYETSYDYEGNYPTPGGDIPFKPDGVCIISFNPNLTDELDLRNKDSYKMLFYNESGFNFVGWLYEKNKKYYYLDLVSMKNIYSNENYFIISPDNKYILQYSENDILLLDYNTKSVIDKFDKNDILIDHQTDYYPTKVKLNYFSRCNSNIIFSDLMHWCTGGIFAMDISSHKHYTMFSNEFYRRFCDSDNEKKDYKLRIISTKKGDYLFRIDGRIDNPTGPTYIYKLAQHSSVQEDKNIEITTDSINAYIPINNGKYPAYMSIYTSDGKLVEESKEIKIDRDYIKHNIELLPAGLYLLRVIYEDGNTMTYKIIK